jgi:2-enoate reductase
MQAAITAAERGFRVILHERNGEIGGQVILGSKVNNKKEFFEIVKYLENQLIKFKVNVKLNLKSNIENIKREKPDIIILACGAKPLIPPALDINSDKVVTAFDVLAGRVTTGQNILVAGGGVIGCETSLFLNSLGKKVTIIEMQDEIASDAPPDPKDNLIEEIENKGIITLKNMRIKDILRDSVTLEPLRDTLLTKLGTEKTITNIETFVLALGSKSNLELYHEVIKYGKKYFIIGDCERPRKALDAIHEGFQIAMKI